MNSCSVQVNIYVARTHRRIKCGWEWRAKSEHYSFANSTISTIILVITVGMLGIGKKLYNLQTITEFSIFTWHFPMWIIRKLSLGDYLLMIQWFTSLLMHTHTQQQNFCSYLYSTTLTICTDCRMRWYRQTLRSKNTSDCLNVTIMRHFFQQIQFIIQISIFFSFFFFAHLMEFYERVSQISHQNYNL